MNRRAVIVALAAALVVPAEGLRQYAYRDPPGILTVCYGSTRDVVEGRFYTERECLKRLEGDLGEAVAAVERCTPGLPEPVAASFADAVFNMGPRIVCDRQQSTAARYLAAGQLVEACNELPRWNRAKVAGVSVVLPGLVKRRLAAQRVCLSGAR